MPFFIISRLPPLLIAYIIAMLIRFTFSLICQFTDCDVIDDADAE